MFTVDQPHVFQIRTAQGQHVCAFSLSRFYLFLAGEIRIDQLSPDCLNVHLRILRSGRSSLCLIATPHPNHGLEFCFSSPKP